MLKVIIMGGETPSGQVIAKQLLNAGCMVTIFTEEPDELKIVHKNYSVIRGDIFNVISVEQAIIDQDVVVSTYSADHLSRFFFIRDGLMNILNSLKEVSNKRLIFINYSDEDHSIISNGHKPDLLYRVFRKSKELRTKFQHEELIRQSSSKFTIDFFDMDYLIRKGSQNLKEVSKNYYTYLAELVQRQILNNEDLGKVVGISDFN